MPPTHHPPLALLGDHAAGRLPAGLALVSAAHLELCPACAAEHRMLEELGGQGLAELPSASDEDDLLESVLGMLDDEPPAPPPAPVLPAFLAGLPLPRALHPHLAAARRWSLLLPGIYEVALPVDLNGLRCSLLRFSPGALLPDHGHRGLELSLVLDGGFDSRGAAGTEVFLTGDLSLREPGAGHDHEVAIHDDGCLVLFARTGRLEARTLKGALGMLLGRL